MNKDGIITLMDDTISPEIDAAATEIRKRMRTLNMAPGLALPPEEDIAFLRNGPLPNLQRLLAEFGCSHRIPRDGNGSLDVCANGNLLGVPMLVRGIIQLCEVGPIDALIDNRWQAFDVVCRAVFLRKPILVVPGGGSVKVSPAHAIVLGQPLTPRDCLNAYADGVFCEESLRAAARAYESWKSWTSFDKKEE
jgi:hypothetical protein